MFLNIKSIDSTNNRKLILYFCPILYIMISFGDKSSENNNPLKVFQSPKNKSLAWQVRAMSQGSLSLVTCVLLVS